eukprot:TRINITY_DN14888_c0_g1_i1.p1 TRINITY_DN14888_c0_g1~~TRINITY_DN14888_c0_g1_i1.p1  ORF type:complete len:378 (+),score=74.05 TRINITY_DN14888_c0_g1_i1:85-1134(+)
MRHTILLFIVLNTLLIITLGSKVNLHAANETFHNPILNGEGADPWVLQWQGYYYMTHSTGNQILILKSKYLYNFRDAQVNVAFAPAPGTPYSTALWAPELHRIDNNFYVYFAATDNNNNVNHRMYVIQANDPNNPMGAYTFKGKIYDPSRDYWAIDGTVLQYENGKNYFIWSGWSVNNGVDPKVQHLYIAEMSSPTSIVPATTRLIKSPDFSWENNGQAVVEGPEIIHNAGRTFIIYSASGSWTPDYCLGMMGIDGGKDPLVYNNWWRLDRPVFWRNDAQSVYGPGHASFTLSPDGTQHWIVYHANELINGGWPGRTARTQQFGWNPDNSPAFPRPLGFGVALPVPSGY